MKALSILFSMGLLVSSPAFACKVRMPDESQIRGADAVLIGTVAAKKDSKDIFIQRVDVNVGKALKGKSPAKVDAIALCGPTIRVGERVVVIVEGGERRAYRSEFFEETVRKAFATVETPKTKSSCERAGGKWGKYGLITADACNMPTSDAGRRCSSNAQCQSVCVANNSVPEGKTAAGQCFGWTMTRGTCMKYVEGGVVGGAICVD